MKLQQANCQRGPLFITWKKKNKINQRTLEYTSWQRAQNTRLANYFQALQRTNVRASRRQLRDTAHRCCRRQPNYNPQINTQSVLHENHSIYDMVNANVFNCKSQTNQQWSSQEQFFAPSLCTLKNVAAALWFFAAWLNSKSAQTQSLWALSNYWTNALTISSRQSAPPTLCTFLP